MSTMLSADDDNETLTRRWRLRGGLDLASKHLAYSKYLQSVLY